MAQSHFWTNHFEIYVSVTYIFLISIIYLSSIVFRDVELKLRLTGREYNYLKLERVRGYERVVIPLTKYSQENQFCHAVCFVDFRRDILGGK